MTRLRRTSRLASSEWLWAAGTALLSLAVIVPRYLMQLRFGPGWDAYAFLLNALEFAGKGKDYVEIYRPPLLSFLVSLFVRAGIDAPWPSFFVDAAITLLGVVGLYLLFRQAMSRPSSVLGAMAFLVLPDIVENLSAGITDLIAVAASIWLVYFVVLAVRKDPKYLTWAVVLVPVGFISRFTAGLMLLVIVFAVVYDGRLERFLKPAAIGTAYSTVVLVPYFAYYWWRFGDPLIQLGEPLIAATATSRVGMLAGAIEPSTFFITGLPGMLGAGWTGWALTALLTSGLALLVAGVFSRSKKLTAPRGLLLALGFCAAAWLSVGPASFVPVLLLWIAVLGWMVPRWLDKDHDGLTFFASLMLFWMALYLTVHSHMLVKVSRYFITMAPPAMFLLVFPFERLFRRRGDGIRGAAAAVTAGLCLAALLGLVATASFARLSHLPMRDFSGYAGASAWLDAHVPEAEREIAADAFPALRYRLRRRLYPMPPFEGGSARSQMERWFDTYSIDYFVTVHSYPPLPGFSRVFRSGDVSILQRTTPVPGRERILLVGRAVDRHLDQYLGSEGPLVTAYLDIVPDDYAGTAGTWIDELTRRQLAGFDAVYLYRFNFHDKEAAEKLLRGYAGAGGTIFVDASGNLGGPPVVPSGVEGMSFLDVLVSRGSVPPRGRARVLEPSLATSCGTEPRLGPFVSEEGGPWFAAAYAPIHPENMRTLVEYAGAPLVFEQRVGHGRIVWISGNLGFHAFVRGTRDERSLVVSLLRDTAGTDRSQ